MQYDILSAAEAAGVSKTSRSIARVTALSVMAGAFIALGGTLSLYLGSGVPGVATANPGISKLLSALAFPVGLFLIVMFGGELFTGNNAVLMPALARKKYGSLSVARNWALVWAGNFVGALAFTWLLVGAAGLVDIEPYNSAIRKIATVKAEMEPWKVFARGIGANWCVCLAVWLTLGVKTVAEKALVIWIPVGIFVALGYEHCIANMFFIPCGIMAGADIAPWLVCRNLIFSTAGNILGGAVFVGALYTRLYSRRG